MKSESLRVTEMEHGAEVAKDPTIPTEYRGIPFEDWLDVFLEYALCLAKQGKRTRAYEFVQAAYDCNVWYHSHESCFLIHVAWIGESDYSLLDNISLTV